MRKTLSPRLGWARAWPAAKFVANPMPRAGAWYAVVSETSGDRLVVAVSGRRVAISKRFLEVRDKRPDRFSVVVRPVGAPGPAKGTPADLGRVYAVCPRCCSRIAMAGQPPMTRCRSCGHGGEVAWWETT